VKGGVPFPKKLFKPNFWFGNFKTPFFGEKGGFGKKKFPLFPPFGKGNFYLGPREELLILKKVFGKGF